MDDFGVAKKASDENEKLQKARRDFEQLKIDEENYLNEREEKEKIRLSGIRKQIESASSLLSSVVDRVTSSTKKYTRLFSTFQVKIRKSLERADEIIDSAVTLKDNADKMLKFINKKYEELQEMSQELGDLDKDLARREEKLKKEKKKVDEKHEEALQLADWAKSGKTYVIKPKHRKK